MFKKILGVFALAGLLGAMSSCTDKSLYGNSSGDLVEVTFTITSEGVLATRANDDGGNVHYPEEGEYPQISDGSKAKRLIWAVYDKEGNLLPELGKGYVSESPAENDDDDDVAGYGQVAEDVKEFPHTITIRLVRGQEYSFAFWAQNKDCKAFNTQDLRAVSVDYKSDGNNLANDELRDAFCKVETFTVTSAAPSMERTIILKRPFAQVNVGIPRSEYEALRQSGVRIKKSKIHMENVATEFDVVSNSTHGDDQAKRQAIDYDYNYIPAYYNWEVENDDDIPTDAAIEEQKENETEGHGKTQYLKIDLNHDGNIAPYGEKNGKGNDARDETYNYMLMAYILPADRNDGTSTYSTTLDRVEFSLQPEDEGQAELTFSLENVPVQRNWRTNIFGSMFTSDVVLKIDLDPFYAGDYNYPEWERIYEGVTYDAMAKCIRISNGAGLVWLSNATNGVWKTAEEFKEDKTHNLGANIGNNASLMLEATGETTWPEYGLFRFSGITVKLDADIDMNLYATLFNSGNNVFTPIGFGGKTEFNGKIGENDYKGEYRTFNGYFDGQNHTIYNLRTVRPSDDKDDRAYGLFGVIGRSGSVKNIRLKDIDIEGHYYTGGVVGLIYGPVSTWSNDKYAYENGGVIIDNCYVDGGKINVTSRFTGSEYDDANNVGGVAGFLYNGGIISNCNVRNLTIRAYRKLAGIVGACGGDYGTRILRNNYVYNVTLIADQFQEYGSSQYSDRNIQIEKIFVGESNGAQLDLNKGDGNTIYGFSHPLVDGLYTTTIGVSSTNDLLSNPPLEIFPRLARYTQLVKINTSILGGPSAYKIYIGDDSHMKGSPKPDSGRVGLWVSGITVDGDGDENPATLDNATVTASGVDEDNDCVVYVKDNATLKNITFHGETYAGQAICLAPAAEGEIILDNVLAYDAKKVLTDDGGVKGGTLTVTGSNFRGYVSLSSGYDEITFTETTFEGSSKRAAQTTNMLELGSGATLTDCKFLVEPGQDYEIKVGSAKFENCKAYAIGKATEVDGIEIKGNCTITVDAEGNVSIKE